MNERSLLGIFGAMAAAGMALLLTERYPNRAQAMTAHGNEKKSLLTVPLEAGLEAVVTLDHATGDLIGYVLNRINRQFFVRYRHNLKADFPETRGQYTVGAGLVDFRGFKSNDRVASGVIYVAEASSNQVAAYAIPWNPELATSTAQPQDLQFIPLDRAQTRFTQLRDDLKP